MCGIAGEYAFSESIRAIGWIQKACDIMAHRGPDGDGYYQDSKISFGHRRLSIIDIDNGTQPMHYQQRYWITYNGEIYNYQALKQQLIHDGLNFTTESDTEVILAAYAQWGLSCLEKFDGIFAFAIWDKVNETLLLARDHLGVKPLLYSVEPDGIYFASELKALLAHPNIPCTVDDNALQDYLTLGYVQSPKTIMQNIKKIPAGHFLYVKDHKAELKSYWKLNESANLPSLTKPEPELINEFEALFEKTVTQQMVSDVPVGSFLSGGIDSSTISFFAERATPSEFKTFSAGFHEPTYSELDYATQVAQHLKTDHYQKVIQTPSMEELLQLVHKYDEPLGDTSLIATYYVSQLAQQHVKVVLSGDGGDELLAGYDTYLADKFQRIYRHVPSIIHNHLIKPATHLIPSSYNKVSWDFKVRQFIGKAHTSPERAHFGWRQMFDDNEVHTLLPSNPSYDAFDSYSKYYDDVRIANPLNQSLYVDIKTWLVDDILTKVDRATMACSLEARVPFLGVDMVEFAMRLPTSLKLRGLKRKYILKQIVADKLPKSIINRKKRGFNSPIGIWMREQLYDDIQDRLNHSSSQLIDVQHPIIQQLWQEHQSGKIDHTFKLWTLISLLLWEDAVLNA